MYQTYPPSAVPMTDDPASVDANLQELARLRSRSVYDTLTSAYNRRHFEQTLKAEWRRSRRRQASIAVLLADIGRLDDRVDPGFIHALERVASLMARQCGRGGDLVARFDGTSFAVLLPDTDWKGAEAVGRRIHERFRHAAIACESAPGGHIQMSVGGACAATPHALTAGPAALLAQAHRALRQALSGEGFSMAPPV